MKEKSSLRRKVSKTLVFSVRLFVLAFMLNFIPRKVKGKLVLCYSVLRFKRFERLRVEWPNSMLRFVFLPETRK